MGITVSHNLSATTPDDPAYEIRPSHWNSNHAVTLDISATEISGLFSNANGVSFGLDGTNITATVKTDYQTSGAYLTTAALSNHSHGNPQLNLTNLSGTTASNSAGFTLSLSAAAPGAGGAVNFSAGTTSSDLDSVVFSNSNGVSFGLNGSTITGTVRTDYQSAGAYLTTAMASNRGSDFVQATAAFAGTNASGTIASGGISVSVAAPGGGAGVTISEWFPYPELPIVTASGLVNNSLYFSPIDVPENLNAYRINFFGRVSTQVSASNNTKSGSWRLSFCLYSRGVGASTERLMSMLSRSAYISFSASSHTRIQYDHPAGILNSTAVSQSSTSGAATNTSTYGASHILGGRVFPFPVSSTLTPGRYWMAVGVSFTSANAQGFMNVSLALQTNASNVAYMPFATVSKETNASWPHVFAGRGIYSATSTAFPATVALSTDHIRQTAPTVVLPFFNVSGYTTATNIP